MADLPTQPGEVLRLQLRKYVLPCAIAFGIGALIASFCSAEEPTLKAAGGAFLEKYCSDCHGEFTQEGDLDFSAIKFDLTDANTSALWKRALEQVLFNEMPPAESDKQPTQTERQAFVQRVEAELQKVGNGFKLDEKMLLPEYGNLVDHEKLFSGEIKEQPYTPARLWRQRPSIYAQLWGPSFGKKEWLSVKIGGNQQETARDHVAHGPHKGKSISYRYFAPEQFANPFYEYVHHAAGFTDYATIVADQASLEALLINAEKMSEILTVGAPVAVVTEVKSKDSVHGNNHGSFVGGLETTTYERHGRIPVAFKRVMDAEGEVSKGDFTDALRVAFLLFLRREPSAADIEHYWEKVFQKNAELGNTMALQAVLIYVAISPEFVYRMEMGLGEEEADGRRMLSSHELVYAIHHAFEDSPAFGVEDFETVEAYDENSDPLVKSVMLDRSRGYSARNSWLVEQMQEGKLKTKADVEAAVRKFVNEGFRNLSPNHNGDIQSVNNSRILQFFREYFGYHKAETVFKDIDKFAREDGFKQFGKHTAAEMMYDTDSLILHILEEDKDVLKELLTTDKVYFTYWDGSNPEDRIKKEGGLKKYVEAHYAQNYNLNPLENEHKRNSAVSLPPEQRCGVLTQPSWLVAHSGNFDNDPVRRGKWIREKLLAGTVMEVPITVDAQIPEDETKTLRERFVGVHQEYCWRCHRKMNPLGMPFEAFNHVGRFRELEKGKPVDTTGAISFSGEEGLDARVENPREMMEKLAASPRVRQSFLRHMFRYWMGRNELLSDSQTLMAMDKTYVESGGSFKETLVTLLTSDSFLYRK